MRLERNNRFGRSVASAILQLLIAILIGSALMILVYCIPVGRIRDHVQDSASIFSTENDGYSWAYGVTSATLDNFTDAIMLNNAVFLGTGSVVSDAMNTPIVEFEGETSQSMNLIRSLESDTLDINTVGNYARYWHGYLIWLKPLLFIMNYANLRVLNMTLQMCLLFAVLVGLFRTGGYRLCLPFGMAVLFLNPVSLAMSLQYSSIYYIMLLGMLAQLKWRKLPIWQVCLWIGIATAFFDFLTYPVAALGINLLLMIELSEDGFADQFRKSAGAAFAWVFGYGGMWVSKWMIAYLLTGNNTMQEGLDTVLFRMDGAVGSGEEAVTFSALVAIKANLGAAVNKPLLLILAILAIAGLYQILKGNYRIRIEWDHALLMLCGALLPFLWYVAVKNHSAIHAFMTFRNLSVTLAAVLLAALHAMQKKGNNEV